MDKVGGYKMEGAARGRQYLLGSLYRIWAQGEFIQSIGNLSSY